MQHAASEAYVYGSSAPLPGPPHELCCGEQKRFGCTPGHTPVNASGSVPDVVPFPWGPIGGFPGDPSWMAAACTIPFGRYTAYGSLSQLGKEYVVCSDYLAFMERNLIGGLAMWGFYGDWIAIDKDSNSTLMSTASLIISAQQGASMAKSLGNSQDATRWTALAAKAGLAMRAAFKDPATGRYDSGKGIQASNAMALYTGVETNGTGGAATALIKDVVTTRGMHLSTGSSASRYILQALELCGSSQGAGTVLAPSTRLSGSHVAAQLAVQTTQPSWGFFVVNASLPQTMWERWDVTPPNVGASSLDHPFLGAGVQRWAQTNAAGLDVGYDVGGRGQARDAMACTIARAEASGIRGGDEIPETFAAECLGSSGTVQGVFSARLSPSAGAVSQIGQASASLQTARGEIRSSWELDLDQRSLSASLIGPHGTPAVLEVPLQGLASVLESSSASSMSRVLHVRASRGDAVVTQCEVELDRVGGVGLAVSPTAVSSRCPGVVMSGTGVVQIESSLRGEAQLALAI